jgi:regulator of ribosome biosynthesis
MGKFDKQLEGEKKLRGVKRNVWPSFSYTQSSRPSRLQLDAAEQSMKNEKKASLALLSRVESDAKKMRRTPPPEQVSDVVNVGKVIRTASKGKGGVTLAKEFVSKRKTAQKAREKTKSEKSSGKVKDKRCPC